MNEAHIQKIAEELGLTVKQVKAVAGLLEEGGTIPFIARYRKEATDSLDEVFVTSIRDRMKALEELDARRETILKSLETHGHLTDELKESVMAAETLSELEDIYLPYKPKRRTRATIAREKGLEPLAETIFEQTGADIHTAAAAFIDPEKGVETVEDALAGARDIIAEQVSEDARARTAMRTLFVEKGTFKSTVIAGMEEKGEKYKDYFEWEEPVSAAPSHRILAMRRGEKEEILNLSTAPPVEDAIDTLHKMFVKGDGPDAAEVETAVTDSYKRLLSRSIETEIRLMTKEKADADAIRIFAENLRQLLMASPLGSKRVMGIDPGFRTGCKVVCLDRQGKLLHNDTIYPHMNERGDQKAAVQVKTMCEKFDIEAIAVGNGTAGRETESFVRTIGFAKEIPVIMVNESGASVYSASEAAREEFPDHDVTVRGSVSIGRRLMDPLSELVKIDPKSIGVGQYQHDVDQTALKQSLDDTVISCVNAVGVDVNRASAQVLTYVSGLGPQLAKNIVTFRNENGPFPSRTVLKKVKRLGPKSFEQCAGFLRVLDGKNPLDASAVHPESYTIVENMARNLDCTVQDLMKKEDLRKQIDISNYVTDTVGLPTLKDIMGELAKPGRDPRKEFEMFSFAEGIEKITDLRPGMVLPGIVTNITAFGAFVDVGVHQDGLAHVSELADRFVKDPAEVVKVHQKVKVTVLEVDTNRNRISLSMKSSPGERNAAKSNAKSADNSTRPEQSKKSGKSIKTEGGKPKTKGNKTQNHPKKDAPFNNPFADLFKGK